MRKISYGEGVERVFPVMSPMIDSIKVVRRGTVVRFAGSTNPARRYTTLWVQAYSGGAWRTVASGRTKPALVSKSAISSSRSCRRMRCAR